MKNLTQKDFMHHTMETKTIDVVGNVKNKEAIMTGHCMKKVEVSDVISIDKTDYTVMDVLENRNHKGVFEDENKKINSFWKIKTSFQEFVDFTK